MWLVSLNTIFQLWKRAISINYFLRYVLTAVLHLAKCIGVKVLACWVSESDWGLVSQVCVGVCLWPSCGESPGLYTVHCTLYCTVLYRPRTSQQTVRACVVVTWWENGKYLLLVLKARCSIATCTWLIILLIPKGLYNRHLHRNEIFYGINTWRRKMKIY